MKVYIELEASDLASLHDTLAEALDLEDLTEAEILRVWDHVPDHLRGAVAHWGVDDSVVRDNIYEWAQKNKGNLTTVEFEEV